MDSFANALVGLMIVATTVAILLAMVRVVKGPLHTDRIVALDILLSGSVGFCVAASVLTGRTVFLDVGIGLAVVGFVSTVGWARLVEKASAQEEQEGGKQ